MSWWRLPGVAMALPFLGGTLVGGLVPPRPLLAVVGLGLALAIGGAPGRALAIGVAASALCWARPAGKVVVPGWVDPERPVEVRGRLERGWRQSAFGWRGAVAAVTLRQGGQVDVWPVRLEVVLGAPPPPANHRRLALKGYLRRAPPLGNQPPVPAGPWRLQVKSEKLVESRPGPAPWPAVADRLRRRAEALFGRAPAGEGPRLARALILGDSSRLDRDLLLHLRRVGLGHLLAVSGLHVGLAASLFWWLAAPLPRRLRQAAPLAAAITYLLLVGARPAILRATGMVLLAGSALATGRPPRSLNSLAWAATGILLVDPAAVDDLGFALTAAATTGIVVLGPALERRWAALPALLRRGLAASAGAQLAALPWTLASFHLMTPLTVLLNLVAVPWTALTLSASFCWLGLVALWPGAVAAATAGLDLLTEPFGWPALLGPQQALILVGSWRWSGGLAIALGLGLLFLGRRPGWRVAGLAIAVALLIPPSPRSAREVVMLDVGQGESILLRDGAWAVLVDGGGWHRLDIGQRVLAPTLARLGVRRLDAVVVSHPDLDHCRGLVEISAYLAVGEVWSATGLGPGGCLEILRRRPGIRWRPLWRGRGARLGSWQFEVLHPAAGSRGGGNDRSLVLRAAAGGRSILLTGDIGRAAERELLRRTPAAALRADVLKVAHHGSAGSSSIPFVERVAPRLALVSAGRRNSYGHPSAEVVDRLETRAIPLRRTDREGMIRLSWPPTSR